MSNSRKRPNRAPTLADVGREAGVSAMAASAVLNGARTSTRISRETRARIREAALKLGYRPNAAARALAQRRMHTIGVAAIINESGEFDHYFLGVFNGIITNAAAHNQNTTVFALHDWDRDSHLIPGFCDGRIDGLILIAPVFRSLPDKLIPPHTPFVALHANVSIPGVINIGTDEEKGAFAIVNDLIASGHRRILHLTGPRGLAGPEARVNGYRHALEASGITFDKDLVVDSEFNTPAGRESLTAWLSAHVGQPLPDAIFGVNDAVAMGCMEVLAKAGYAIPKDISVVGFDDTLAARMTIPQLTTVAQPLRQMGMRAVDELLERIKHQREHTSAESPAEIVLPVEIIHRSSTRRPAAHRPKIRPMA